VLLSDVQVKDLPAAVLKEQDVLCVYRTDSEENFIARAERLVALQENAGDRCAMPAVLCFTDADSAKAYICGSGLWAPRQSQVVGATWDDVLPLLASTKGNLRWISGEFLPLEELPDRHGAAQGVQLIFRGSRELSMFDVMENRKPSPVVLQMGSMFYGRLRCVMRTKYLFLSYSPCPKNYSAQRTVH